MTKLRQHIAEKLQRKPRAPTRAERIATAARANAAQMKRSLHRFFKRAWDELDEGEQLEDNWHIKGVCDEVQALLEGWLVANGHGNERMRMRVIRHWYRHGLTYRQGVLLVQNAIFNLPPISLKSKIIMAVAPAWVWLWAPKAKFGCTSATDANVRRDSEAHHKLVSSKWYIETFRPTWKLTKRAFAIQEWKNTAGGLRLSRTFHQGWVGTHNDIMLVDDPDDSKKVWNEATRVNNREQYSTAIENRVNNEMKVLRIIVQQRVHPEDLTWYLRQKKKWSSTFIIGWALFALAMEFGRGPPDMPAESVFGFRDPRTRVGELIQPSRFGDAQVIDKRTSLTDYIYEAQYNQNPDVVNDGLIKPAVIRFFRLQGSDTAPRPRPLGCDAQMPAYELRYREDGEMDLDFLELSVDATFGEEHAKASAVGLTLIGGKGLRRFWLDDLTAPMTYDDAKAAVRAVIRTWMVKELLIEKKATGPTLIKDMEKEIAEGVITEVEPGTFKRVPLIWPNGKRAIVKVTTINVPSEDKIARAMPMIPEFNAGLIYVLDGAPWVGPALSEICTFPKSKRRDRIDCWSQLQAHHRDESTDLSRAIALSRW